MSLVKIVRGKIEKEEAIFYIKEVLPITLRRIGIVNFFAMLITVYLLTIDTTNAGTLFHFNFYIAVIAEGGAAVFLGILSLLRAYIFPNDPKRTIYKIFGFLWMASAILLPTTVPFLKPLL